MKFNDTYYPGSYIITPINACENLSAYTPVYLNDYYIYLAEDVLYEMVENGTGKILIIGYCLDIRDGQKAQNEILESLLNESNIIEELDYINGRYLIIKQYGSNVELYSDASQLQPLTYHKSSKTLASHDRLLAQMLTEYGYEINQRDDMNHHTELDYTRFHEIFKINPSLMLNLGQFKFTRIYPREKLSTISPNKIFEKMKPYLDQSIEWLRKNENEKFLTITGGIDSRVSASLSKDIPEIEYLTYLTPRNKLATNMAKRIYKIDEDITRDMKRNLGWKHNIINIFDFQIGKEQYNYFLHLYNSKHSYGLRNYYENFKKYNHALHIKSTVFGMGKADFNHDLDNKAETFNFYKSCLHGLPQDLVTSSSFEDEVREYFNRNLIEEGTTLGRHYFDLFHLESRMGNWHSVLTLETDPQTDEFIFTNTRKLIDFIQEPPIKDRRNYTLYKNIINHYWPVLLHFGVNNKLNLYEQGIENNISYKLLNIETENNLIIKEKNEQLSFKPKRAPINFDEVFKIKISSEEDLEQKLILKSTYSNPKGQGNIRVIIRSNNEHSVYDITKLNEGIELKVNSDGILILMMYNRLFVNDSWKDAGELLIEQL